MQHWGIKIIQLSGSVESKSRVHRTSDFLNFLKKFSPDDPEIKTGL